MKHLILLLALTSTLFSQGGDTSDNRQAKRVLELESGFTLALERLGDDGGANPADADDYHEEGVIVGVEGTVLTMGEDDLASFLPILPNSFATESVTGNPVGPYLVHEVRGENDGGFLSIPTPDIAQKVLISETLTGTDRTSTITVENYVDNTLYVDLQYGDDATALRERSDLPFATLAAADTAAEDGDTLILRPGEYPGQTFTNSNLTIQAEGVQVVDGRWVFSDKGDTRVLGYPSFARSTFNGISVVAGTKFKMEVLDIGDTDDNNNWGIGADGVGTVLDIEFRELIDNGSVPGSIRGRDGGQIIATGLAMNGGVTAETDSNVSVDVQTIDIDRHSALGIGSGGASGIPDGTVNVKSTLWRNDIIAVGHAGDYDGQATLQSDHFVRDVTQTNANGQYMFRTHGGFLDVSGHRITMDITGTLAVNRMFTAGEAPISGAGIPGGGNSVLFISSDIVKSLQTGAEQSVLLAAGANSTTRITSRVWSSNQGGTSGTIVSRRKNIWATDDAKVEIDGTYVVNTATTNGGTPLSVQSNAEVTIDNAFLESMDPAEPVIWMGDGGSANHNPTIINKGTSYIKMAPGSAVDSVQGGNGTFPATLAIYNYGQIVTNRPFAPNITVIGNAPLVVADADMPPSPSLE